MWVPEWNRNAGKLEERMEAILAGPALGQTGSSTRQELTAWILVLSLPLRSMYATDSASMLSKAKTLLTAAVSRQEKEERGEKVNGEQSPFKKPWGLQRDGDLWGQAWKAIISRGAKNQDLRKVKGHATADDIKEGRSTEADKEANDRSDENADRGVKMVGGKGLTTLGAWVAKRHDRYKKFMKRVQKMIAVITLAEKNERAEDKTRAGGSTGVRPGDVARNRRPDPR